MDKKISLELKSKYYQILSNPNNFMAKINEVGDITAHQNFINFYDDLFSYFKSYININSLSKAKKLFLSKFPENDIQNLNNSSINQKVHSKINENTFYYHEFLSIIFNTLLDQNTIKDQLNKNIKFENLNKIYDLNASNYGSTYSIYVNENYNFYFEKKYSKFIENIKTDQNILFKNFYEKNDPTTKFIVHAFEQINDKTIHFPYYPNGTLSNFLSNTNKKTFTNVDKIVIILEILYGLNTLYKNEIYHQNLSSNAIFIDKNRDAYIGDFVFDLDFEKNCSQLPINVYFRHPELLSIIGKYEKKVELPKKIEYDIFSLGILMFEIITEKNPRNFFSIPRQEKINQMKSDYINLLFKNYKNFDEFFQIKGISSIIKKCMTNEYNNYDDIIKEIKKNINDDLSEIVEYRINNAMNPHINQCEFSDIVSNYYEGNLYSKKIITSFFDEIKSIIDIDMNLIENNDIITAIFEYLDIKNGGNKNKNFIYNDLFDLMIKQNAFSLLDHENKFLALENNYQKKLMQLSIDTNKGKSQNNNNNYQIENYSMMHSKIEDITNIIPITSLDNFSFSNEKMKQIYSYILAKELLIIHSYNLYHGELSKKSIGIYYNSEMKTFIPSIIHFYYFYKYKKIENKGDFSKNSINLEKMQQKDIKNLVKILHELDDKIDFNFSNNKICSIVNILYNRYLESNSEFKKMDKYMDYKSFNLTFSTISDVYYLLNENDNTFKIFNDYSEKFIQIENIIKNILNFSYEKLNNLKPNEEFYVDIYNAIEKIKEINDQMLNLYFDQNQNQEIKIINNENNIIIAKQKKLCQKNKSITIESLDEFKMNSHNHKLYKLIHKYIPRTLEIVGLDDHSIKFLLIRYIKALYPFSNYRIKFNINSNRVNKYDDIINMMHSLGHNTNLDEEGNLNIIIDNIGK